MAGLLLPHGDDVQEHAQHGGTLHHLHQLLVGEVGQQRAAQRAAADHAHQQHHVHQRHHARAGFFGRQVGGQRQAGGLRGLQPGADQHESQPGAQVADPRHAELTGSTLARDMLATFDDYVDHFWLVKPKAAKLDSLLKD